MEDTQKKQVYNAETLTLFGRVGTPLYPRLADSQRFVDQVLTSRWWKRRSDVVMIAVRPSDLASASADTDHQIINLPTAYRNGLSLCHELAHFLTDDDCEVHGPEFVINYLDLVKQFLPGYVYTALKEDMARYGVNRKAKRCKACRNACIVESDERPYCRRCRRLTY